MSWYGIINFYKDNPTAGSTDGTIITPSDPLTARLDASENEEKIFKVAVRCEEGYQTVPSDITGVSPKIYITGDGNTSYWRISLDGNSWSDSITIDDVIDDTNTIFYVKATSDSSEEPHNDPNVELFTEVAIMAV